VISEVCPCGGEVKQTTWFITTERGLVINRIETMTLPVSLTRWCCESCGRNQYKYKDWNGVEAER
jgi:hypothetical protein